MTSARRFPVFLVLTLALFAVSSCNFSVTFGDGIEGSGDLITERFDFDDFDAVDISGTFDAFVTVGDASSVEILIDDNLAKELDVRVRDGWLLIALKDGVSVNRGTLEATITVPALNEVQVSGASSAVVVDQTGGDQRYSISGASDVDVTSEADWISLDVSGSSDINMNGTATSLTIDASGASDLRLDLDVGAAEIDISGASSVDILSVESVTGSLSGASDLRVPAGARTEIDSSGASEVRRR